ncbi:hypothetical protein [Burkholderia cepacia]|uniref:hypothetical protein n=1 Tax=Burkholderia cepacia TaxID=292 RepID=UPI002AB630CD|nr:hypothetical protein [Burkholderia cepacia]
MNALTHEERVYFRDRLRAARYAALADAEGFGSICFAVEALGVHLSNREAALNNYLGLIRPIAERSIVLTEMPRLFPGLFSTFDVLYRSMQAARNDAMHSGVYARHLTVSAIELCIGLEEAIMQDNGPVRTKVCDFMVRGVVSVQSWQPVAHARQMMLMHSFTYLPVKVDGVWMLVPEVSMAKYLRRGSDTRKVALALSIADAWHREENGLELKLARVVSAEDDVDGLLADASSDVASLWLVSDGHDDLAGVLSPFELM